MDQKKSAVVFYSNTGQSRAIAEYFAERSGLPLADIERFDGGDLRDLVLVFPVYCQNTPMEVKTFLRNVRVENLTVIATYGKMCHGNVLYEIGKRYPHNIVAAAYIPTKHSYIENDTPFSDHHRLEPLFRKIKEPRAVNIPRSYKNPFADLFPIFRSRLGLKIYKNSNCDGCDICGGICPRGAISAGRTNGKCIRCLKCVSACPRQALKVKLSLPLKVYLRKKKVDRLKIYT